MSSIEERVNELEAKVSFLELANQEMSDQLYAQRQEFDLYMRRVTAQLERMDNESPQTSLKDEVPPHY